MHTLSNNRNDALGAWYVNANNAPSNSNANNWGGRTFTQRGKLHLQKNLLCIYLNQPLIKGDSDAAYKPPCQHLARFASQSPLKKRGLVGVKAPLEKTRAERDAA